MPAGHTGLRWITLALSAFAVAQQQRPQDGSRYQSSPPENSILQPRTLKHTSRQASRIEVDVPRGRYRDTDANAIHTSSGNNQRAIATLAPADSSPAVRAPLPARSAAGSDLSGLRGTSQEAVARSLRDWEVEDLVLLATIDGKIHAVDRKTGNKEKWVFPPEGEPSRPIVTTEYHQRNLSDRDATIPADEWLWIVEPTEDGALYIYKDNALQKIGATMKTLTDLSTWASTEEPLVIYTAKKDATLYTLNAATGRMIKEVSSDAAMFGFSNMDSCKPVTGFEGLDDEECESKSHFMISRTDYTVVIRNQTTLEPICTIRYSEWAANGRDRDLGQQYLSTADNKYFLSSHDGRVMAVDHNNAVVAEELRALSQKKLSSPVVRVFDVARHIEADPKEATLVILPQPSMRLGESDTNPDVFVSCTDSGGWFAMSEQKYPFVTVHAKAARCYANEDAWRNDVQFFPGENKYSPRKWELFGKHSLADPDEQDRRNMLTISAPLPQLPGQQPIQIDDGNETKHILIGDVGGRSWLAWLKSWATVVLGLLSLPVVAFLITAKSSKFSTKDGGLMPPIPPPTNNTIDFKPAELPPPIKTAEEPERKVRFVEPEPSEKGEESEPSPIIDPSTPAMEGGGEGEALQSTDTDGAADTPKKKKAHRGQRGGKKRRKKTLDNGSEEGLTEQIGRQIDGDHSMQPDEISGVGGATDVSNVKFLTNLEVYKDRPIGYGSGGTTVFEGKKGNRLVAVKQIMPIYYEVASQEVALLEQSDDHPNVIRYFDHQRDNDFIYIALELCQASLFDLYREGDSRDGLPEERLSLVNQINSNISGALYQLADGLAHLHKLRLIHRDIKPHNILITYPKKHETSGARLVISDFGLCKTLPDNASTLVGATGNAGTIGWKAPELIGKLRSDDNNMSSSQHSQKGEMSSSQSSEAAAAGVKRAVDIFSLGCVFFYVLTNGGHPFDVGNYEAWTVMRELNIKEGRRDFGKLDTLGPDRHEPEHLLGWMLEYQPEHR